MPITDLATNVILDNVGKVYFLKTGVYRDQVGLDNNHPLSSVSALLIHIEDGVPQNVMVANYAPSKMASWASHDFPLWYRGQVEYTITGESSPRTFAQYFTYVPSILVAMNKNGTTIMNVDVTITQNTGANLLGGFADLTALNAEFPPTEELSDDLATAYVYDSGTKGFYRVAWNSGTSEWVWQLVDQALVTYGVQTKQYNVLPIKVQRGFAPNQTPLTVSDEVIRLIYQEIAYVNAVIANHTDLLGGLRTDVDGINLLISEILNGTQEFTKILLSDGAGGTAEFYYDGIDPILKYRNITGELFKNLFLEVEPASGVTFENGMNVMYAGSIGGSGKRLAKPTILTELQVNPNLYLGMITEVTPDGHGIVNWYGNVNNLNTNGMTLGAVVYVGDNGTWTTTKPVSPFPQIPIGLIERVHGTQGRINVRPNIGNYLGGLHDVYTNGHTFVGGETIKYNIITHRYEIFDLDGALADIGILIDDLETFRDTTVPATYETKADATSKLALKVDKTTEIANVAIGEGISLETLKTAIGLATTSLSGLMSATDKGYLNELYALLDTDDIDAFVDTLGEVLLMFSNYPEGTDLVTQFSTKVDKVLSSYDTLTGESVVGTELVYVDAGGTTKKMTLAELFEAANTASGAFVPNGEYKDLTAGFAQKSALGVEIDTKFGTIDGEIDELDTQVDLVGEQKTDKLESRQVGTTQMSFVNGKLTSVVSDNVSTYLAYDTNGNIKKITETYADGKSYETTYTKDVEGRIKTMTKAEV